jgi:hypothetical protein
MGMFDTIWVKCPKCGEESGFQSKSGDCILGDYTLENCPDDVMVDANRHSPYTCDCGTIFKVDIPTRKAVVVDGFS